MTWISFNFSLSPNLVTLKCFSLQHSSPCHCHSAWATRSPLRAGSWISCCWGSSESQTEAHSWGRSYLCHLTYCKMSYWNFSQGGLSISWFQQKIERVCINVNQSFPSLGSALWRVLGWKFSSCLMPKRLFGGYCLTCRAPLCCHCCSPRRYLQQWQDAPQDSLLLPLCWCCYFVVGCLCLQMIR